MLNRAIPVIADAYVDMEFGTGALKVTPGHDPNDYEIGQAPRPADDQHHEQRRHAQRRTLAPTPGWIASPRARSCGKTWRRPGWWWCEEHTHQVGHCQRCGTVVEPLLSEQWWVKMEPLAEPALAAVRNGDPDRAGALHQGLLPLAGEHPRLVHQPPTLVGPPHPHLVRAGRHAFAARSEAEAQAAPPTTASRERCKQDPDVLDTWFSSGCGPSARWAGRADGRPGRYYPTA
jgi:valyl-tRNA synthetase